MGDLCFKRDSSQAKEGKKQEKISYKKKIELKR